MSDQPTHFKSKTGYLSILVPTKGGFYLKSVVYPKLKVRSDAKFWTLEQLEAAGTPLYRNPTPEEMAHARRMI